MFDGSTYCEDDDSAALVDGVAKGFTNVLSSNIAIEAFSAIVDVEHVVVVFRARQHPLPLESEELEVLEQPEQFLEQLTVDHQYDHHT
ncbi:hypothetical protein Tco_0430092, partial [Tanacetum coccineum]